MLRFGCVAVVLATTALSAYAHGGNYGGGGQAPPSDPGPPLGPGWHTPDITGDPSLTPSTSDPEVAVTRWEAWWNANKEALLRLGERMRGDAPGTTPGRKKSEREAAWEKRRDEAARKRLAAIFVEALGDEEFEVRTAAAIALGKSGDPSASEPLRRAAVKDAHKDVRDSAVLGLGLLGRPIDLPFLEDVLHDREQDPRHRAFAAFAIGLIGGDDAAVPLLRAVDDGPEGGGGTVKNRPELVASVYVAMGLTGSDQVLPALRRAIHDEHHDTGVRSFALIALGRLADRETLSSAVAFLAHEKDLTLRRAAAVALGKIARADDGAAVDVMLASLHAERDPLVRHSVAMSLGGLASAQVRDALRSLFKDGSDSERPFAALALAIQHDTEFAPQIRAALAKGGDESETSSFCLALGLMGDTDSASLLEKQLSVHGRPWLAGYAGLALGMMGNTASAATIRARLEPERDGRLRMNLAVSLGLLHDATAKTYLVDTLRGDGYLFERGSAAMALGALRLSSAAGDLEAVYRDHKERDILRAFAVIALGEIADPSPVPKLSRFAIDGNYAESAKIDPLHEVLSIY